MRLAVQGIGLVSGFGNSESDIKSLFQQGSSAEYSPESINGRHKNKYVYRSSTSDLISYIPKKKLRRIDHYSRMALLGAGKALKDSGSDLCSGDRTGIIVASGYGALNTTFAFLDSYIEKGDKLSFPIHFSNSVHNAAAAYISILYGITGPSLTVSQFEMSFFSALLTASVWIRQGYANAVLVGCTDEFCDVVGYCIHGFSGESIQYKDDIYSAGEGAAFFLLTGDKKDHKSAYGYIDEISIENHKKSEIDIPQKSLVIISPGTLAACGSDFIHGLIEKTDSDLLIHTKAHFPTDTGFDAAFAINSKEKDQICFIKAGANGEYGKILFNRH